MKAKLRATIKIVQEYEADSDHYGHCEFVRDMIEMDKRNFMDDPMMFIDGMLDDPDTKAEIKIVKVK